MKVRAHSMKCTPRRVASSPAFDLYSPEEMRQRRSERSKALSLAREAAMLREHVARLQKELPSAFLVPNVAQSRCLHALKARPFPKDLVMLGGNGTGKTVVAVKAACGIVFGPDSMVGKGIHPDYEGEKDFEAWRVFRERAEAENRPISGRIVAAADSLKGNGAMMQRLTRYFPKGCWKTERLGKTYASEIWCWDTPELRKEEDKSKARAIIEVKTHDQPKEQHAGPDCDFIIFDEPCPPDVYEESIGRCRANPDAIRIHTLTPLELAGWLIDELVTGADGVKVVVITGSLWDNCKDWHPHDEMWSGGKVGVGRVLTRGNIERETIDDMISAWRRRSPLTVEARIWGKATHTAGSIYTIFSPAIHCREGIHLPDGWEEYPIWNVIDPHHKRPPAVGWFVQGPHQNWCIGEYPFEDYTKITEKDKTIQDYAEIIQEIEDRAGIADRVIYRYGDPNSLKFRYATRTEDSDFAQDLQALYQNEGLYYELANDNLLVGHEDLNELLHYEAGKELGPGNFPRLEFTGNIMNDWRPMVNMPNGLSRYRVKRKADESNRSPASMKSILDEVWKDFPDVARYFATTVKHYPFEKLSERRGLWDIIQSQRIMHHQRVAGRARRR